MNAFPTALERQLLDEARSRYPHEAVGMIVRNGEKLTFVPGRNISDEPERFARLHPDDYEAAEQAGELAFHFHSHTNERPTPSDGDKTMSEQHQLPLVILSWPTAEKAFYFPTGWRAPLLGRPFVHGVLDCYSLIQDAFEERHGIVLPDFERRDDWWMKGDNLYLENFEKAGFRRMSEGEELRVDDCPMMQIGLRKDGQPCPPNHAAIYVGDGAILHHLAKRLSRVQPYHADFGYYSRAVYGLFRHRELEGQRLDPWRPENNDSRGWPARV